MSEEEREIPPHGFSLWPSVWSAAHPSELDSQIYYPQGRRLNFSFVNLFVLDLRMCGGERDSEEKGEGRGANVEEGERECD